MILYQSDDKWKVRLKKNNSWSKAPHHLSNMVETVKLCYTGSKLSHLKTEKGEFRRYQAADWIEWWREALVLTWDNRFHMTQDHQTHFYVICFLTVLIVLCICLESVRWSTGQSTRTRASLWLRLQRSSRESCTAARRHELTYDLVFLHIQQSRESPPHNIVPSVLFGAFGILFQPILSD